MFWYCPGFSRRKQPAGQHSATIIMLVLNHQKQLLALRCAVQCSANPAHALYLYCASPAHSEYKNR
jgi:hypothetical protein